MAHIMEFDNEVYEICELLGVRKGEANCIKLWFNIDNVTFSRDLYNKVVEILNINLPKSISLDIEIQQDCIVTATAEFFPTRRESRNERRK